MWLEFEKFPLFETFDFIQNDNNTFKHSRNGLSR